MKKIGFIILHYKVYNITIRCVNSIEEKYQKIEKEIVIIDNASEDDSSEKIKKYYQNKKNIHIIKVSAPTGFSHGNNIGYKFLKENYELDFIIVCNNDLIFQQIDFVEKIYKCYEKENFYLLGPDIRNINGGHQSPIRKKGRNSQEIKKYIEYCKNILDKSKWYTFKRLVGNKFQRLYKLYSKLKYKKLDVEQIDYLKPMYNVVVHGSCIIISKKYIENYALLFEPEVIFYHEEELMWYKLIKNKNKIIYQPQIYVIHDHSCATKTRYLNENERTIFEATNYLSSAKILYDVVKKYEEYSKK